MMFMLKTVVFGVTGFAGTAIAEEALSRRHEVLGVARSFEGKTPPLGVATRAASLYDQGSTEELAEWADVMVFALPGRPVDGRSLSDEIPWLLKLAAANNTRVGVVGGSGGLLTAPGGPRLVDTPEFPDAVKPESLGAFAVYEALQASAPESDWFYLAPSRTFGARAPGVSTGHYRVGADQLLVGDDGESAISGADYALAFVDELEDPQHHNERFTVGY